jgi:hypothetical protein
MVARDTFDLTISRTIQDRVQRIPDRSRGELIGEIIRA